ncbi:hypothetical protein [Marinibacterium profundimaris]|uniref:hypothetical protein n=1 Tax=Marinibacterium profundimaris TaxID=1679460 RepID=UPI000B528168|nr:hypothetical protein [Marinibacterium profundimaris]
MQGNPNGKTPAFAEDIRLVIWDLDETFWDGTLEEGEITIPPAHAEIVKTLAQRGIVSSICSKNLMDPVRARLEAEELWDWFVFPAVAYVNKSGMVQATLDAMGLRAPTVLFIDDNSFNRGEVAELVDGINVADETVIASLLDHPQLQGKPDPELSRLDRYRVLQTKHEAITTAEAPEEFLRSCDIRVSFHYDVAEQFERIHDMVNRTNQLNFTKLRWDPDLETARRDYMSDVGSGQTNPTAYIKVRDKFGYYGICGFFENRSARGGQNALKHFLFSCRSMNMGVEQFVYQRLDYPPLTVADPVVTTLRNEEVVDWITVVEDAEVDAALPGKAPELSICLHGPCVLGQTSHYLRTDFRVEEEFQYPNQGWAILPVVRNMALADEMAEQGIHSKRQLDLTEDFAGIDLDAIGSGFFREDGEDVLVWSFSLELGIGLYRNKKTGLVFPLSVAGFHQEDLTTFPYETIAEKRSVKRAHYAQVAKAFERVEADPEERLLEDLRKLAAKIEATGKPVIVVDVFDNHNLIDRKAYQSKVAFNEMVHSVLDDCPLVHFVRFSDCVTSPDQEVSLNHFRRDCYVTLAELIRTKVAEIDPTPSGRPARRAPPRAKPPADAAPGLMARIRRKGRAMLDRRRSGTA